MAMKILVALCALAAAALACAPAAAQELDCPAVTQLSECAAIPECKWVGGKRNGRCVDRAEWEAGEGDGGEPSECKGVGKMGNCLNLPQCRWNGSKRRGACRDREPGTFTFAPSAAPVVGGPGCAANAGPAACKEAGCKWLGGKKAGQCIDLPSAAPTTPTPAPSPVEPTPESLCAVHLTIADCKEGDCKWQGGKLKGRCLVKPTDSPTPPTVAPTPAPVAPTPQPPTPFPTNSPTVVPRCSNYVKKAGCLKEGDVLVETGCYWNGSACVPRAG